MKCPEIDRTGVKAVSPRLAGHWRSLSGDAAVGWDVETSTPDIGPFEAVIVSRRASRPPFFEDDHAT